MLRSASKRLEPVIARLDVLGVARTVEDLRVISLNLLSLSAAHQGKQEQLAEIVARLEGVRTRLALGGYLQCAAELDRLLAELPR